MKGIRLITSDACIGLAESAAEFFPEALWQRCVVHWYRNIFSHVPSTRVREIAAMLKAIHASEDIAAAREKAIQVIEKLRGLRLTRAAELVEAAVEETLSYYAFPEEHWRRIRTNNPLERILREIRRRTRVVGAFPDGQSALNLAAARLRHIAGTAWSTKVAAPRRREVRRSSRPREYLTEREIEKLMVAASGNRWGHRDATAILIAYRHGFASELVALRWDDVDFRATLAPWRRNRVSGLL